MRRSADTAAKAQQRRRFLDELKQHVPIHPITGRPAEIVARIGGEQALKGITVPFADLIIGPARWNSDMPLQRTMFAISGR